MNFPSVQWEGGLIGPETLEKLGQEDTRGQRAADFGLTGKVKDEIAQAWSDAKDQWRLFQSRMDRVDPKDHYGTSRTRQFWVQPLLALLGYDLENTQAVEAGGKSFAISHWAKGRRCPVHVVGFTESLDKKREGVRFSPHSLVQEYLNLQEDVLYALVTNGLQLRLLRDSSRLVKLNYLEFNLERMFDEGLYSDFAVLFRLLHSSRWPQDHQDPAECFLEDYHQLNLDEGTAIRAKLSGAVKVALETWGNGFLNHPDNEALRAGFRNGRWTARTLQDNLLTLVYRTLFLLVIEERGLVHTDDVPEALRSLYFDNLSLGALRRKLVFITGDDARYFDLWEAMKQTFRLFENEVEAHKVGLASLDGDLFDPASLALLADCRLDNASFGQAFAGLDAFENDKKLLVRVNYASLNVEEFGSVYEGLLDLEAKVEPEGNHWVFRYDQGEDRGRSGSHYTPEELVQPLIEHALEPQITEALKSPDPEAKLLALKVCDDACGSGHILLNAGRRIALELARLRTQADNPDPSSYRHALRQVISRCLYGVDRNPQAVRLCKVALWLESHSPGESLGFLDHHIKVGDSLVGLARPEDLLKGIPEEAFAYHDGDDKDFATEVRKRHKKELNDFMNRQSMLNFDQAVGQDLSTVVATLDAVAGMDDATPEAAERKALAYAQATGGESWKRLKALSDTVTGAFFVPKKPNGTVVTEATFRALVDGTLDPLVHPGCEVAGREAEERKFFHWFLEFAEVMQGGGFDCFLGNPPFLGNRKLKGTFGERYLDYLTTEFAPAGAIDLVGYFVRRNYALLKPNRALGTLATNTLAQGGTREGSLEVIETEGGTINMAVRSRPWPGAAAVEVSLLALFKGVWTGKRLLDGKPVDHISTYLDDQTSIGNPFPLAANVDQSFQGSIVLGQGFVLTPEQAQALIARNPKNREVLFPYLNGEDLNSRPDQSPSRWVINFHDWPLDRTSASDWYSGPVAADYPDCLEIAERLVKPERTAKVDGEVAAYPWWHHWRPRHELYRTIAPLERVIVVTIVSKTLAFHMYRHKAVFSHRINVFAMGSWVPLSLTNSVFHSAWAWKYSSTMKSDLNYSPSDCFETFPFPSVISESMRDLSLSIDDLGMRLDSLRHEIMLGLNIGLTKLYNAFHNPEYGDPKYDHPEPLKIEALRDLHRQIDLAVRDAYGWIDLDLGHGFHELEFLPENDRVRYTVSTPARKEILKRLLALNHQRHAEEVAAGLVDETGKVLKKAPGAGKGRKKKDEDEMQGGLF